jgi:plasmid stabilization system protein ParE
LAQVGFSKAAFEDFERIFDFYAKDDPEVARAQVNAIQEGVSILAEHPLIGRLVRGGLRELVISRGKTGFVALYRFSPTLELVSILRILHQRELSYPQA